MKLLTDYTDFVHETPLYNRSNFTTIHSYENYVNETHFSLILSTFIC